MDTSVTDGAGDGALKGVLRKQALAARKAVTDHARRNAAIATAVRALIAERFATGIVAAYLPIRGEADPLPGLADHAGGLALPVIIRAASPLIFRAWRPGDALEDGMFRTRHPLPAAPEVRPALILLPLVGFDATGNRLGYGGGYYDRTLEALRRSGPVAAVGLAFAAQEVGPIPAEATDQPLDGIVTEDGLRRFG